MGFYRGGFIMFKQDIFAGITLNLFLLLLVIFIYSMTALGSAKRTIRNMILLGLLIGLVGIAIMLSPMALLPGFVLDTRSILIAITGFFFGVIPTVIAAVMMAIYRLSQGGIGAIPGILTLIVSAVLGVLAHKYRFNRLVQIKKYRILELYVFGIVVHIGMLLCMLALPNQMAVTVLPQISLPIMIVYPIGTLLLGLLFFYQIDQSSVRERFQLYVENAPFGIFVVDEKGHYQDVNEAGAQITGYSKVELLEKTIGDLSYPEDLEEALSEFSNLVRTGKLYLRNRYINRKGEIRNWEIKAVKMDDNLFLGYTTDITMQIQQETEIRSVNSVVLEINDRLQLALHAGDLAVYDWDLINDTLLWDDQMYRLYGLDRKRGLVIYDFWMNLIHSDDQLRVKEAIALALSGENDYDTDFRTILPDGTKRTIKAYGQITRDTSGKPIKMTGINFDITIQRQNEMDLFESKEKAEAANAAKDRFLAMMSHEIRTPMNGFMGMIQLMQMTKLSVEQEEYLRIAKFSADALLAVVNDILDYSKIDAGKMSLDISLFNLKSVIGDTVALFSLSASNKSLPVELKFDEAVPEQCIGDSLKIRQVIANLLGNAVKFTHSGKIDIEIRVAEKLDARRIRLQCVVTDTGIGIPAEKIDLLFKGFSQIDSSNTRKFGGTGLGLAISKALADMMAGSIEVESQELIGSRFTFFWVVEVGRIEATVERAQDEIKTPNERTDITLLVVEDDAVSRKVIEAMGQRKGWTVLSVASGIEALTILKNRRFDLICMDVQMPDMDGYETTIAIREIERKLGIHTPIIALTANALQGDREKCIQVGMSDYLSKPINAEQFYELVNKLGAYSK